MTLSAVILGTLLFIVFNFYIFSSVVNLNSFFYAFLLLSLLTDGFFVLIHLPRRTNRGKQHTSFTKKKLSIVIASYNGADVIAETIKGARAHVPLENIIVVSDASTDKTAEIARKLGVRVIVNEKNLHKVSSINVGLGLVKTPYVLIMDDDTLIGDTFIPTSLLDDGYTAVAFNVMPVKENSLINDLQRFEYRTTMQVGKHMRAATGAIGNISGAIGLYRTVDLVRQIKLHSGQFAGEDEQRTLLAHMYGEGKGITYTDSLVLTKAPATYRDLFRQRAFSWSLSVPELFILYWRVLLSPRFHYLLKAEKAYLIYIYLTEPLRILFLWSLFIKPQHLVYTYGFYVLLNFLIWLRLGRKDSLRTIIMSPLYTLGLTVCRFIGYFYWLKIKTNYLWRKLHRNASDRALLFEYALVFMIIVGSWVISIQHFRSDMHLFYKIRNDNLTSNDSAFNYDSSSSMGSLIASTPSTTDGITVLVEQGDSTRAIAHKAVDKYIAENLSMQPNDDERWRVDLFIASRLPTLGQWQPNLTMQIPKSVVVDALALYNKGVSQ